MSDIEVLQVLGSTLQANGTVSLQTGDAVSGKVVDDNVQQMPGFGIACRPGNPNPGKDAAEVVVVKKSGSDIAIGGRDGRYATIVGNMDEGETIVYAPGSTAYCAFKNDGTVSMGCNSQNDPDGYSHYVQISPLGFFVHHQWGTMKLDATGFHVTHTSGAKIDLGAVGGLPPPLDALSSYFTASAASVGIEGSLAHVGSAAPGVSDNAVKTLPLHTFLTIFATAISTAVKACVPAGPAAATAFDATIQPLLAALKVGMAASTHVS